jgi:hypothetical protein
MSLQSLHTSRKPNLHALVGPHANEVVCDTAKVCAAAKTFGRHSVNWLYLVYAPRPRQREEK